MRIVIAGGGSVGRFIAEQLGQSGHEITMIERDTEVVNRHHGLIAGVHWMKGDACDVETLTAAQLMAADVIAAVTGDDEDNLVISLLAKQEFAVPRVVARVNNPKNEWMFNESWGVDTSVSTPHLITGLVQEAVTVGSLVRLLAFEGGRARLCEVTLADGSPAADRAIHDLAVPREATVVAILRDDRLVVPRGDTVVRVGDEVIVLVTAESEEAVRAVLVGPPQH